MNDSSKSAQAEYVLGYSQRESRRLQVQAEALQEGLRFVLRNAGLREGMRVLDVGCGIGDVSMLAAQIVGASGSVVGVDRSEASLETARRRARESGAENVEYRLADLNAYEHEARYDALIGRFVLLYLPDPAAVVRRLCKSLELGGVVFFQETDMTQARQVPRSDLFQAVNGWIFGAFKASGANIEMGGRLLETFRGAGLPWPDALAMTPAGGGPDSPYYDFLASMVQTMQPVIERAGLASAAEIDLPTLAERLRRDGVEHERMFFPPQVVSAAK